MKWTTRILLAMVIVLVAGLALSNMQIKKVYDKLDKTDSYWTYESVMDQHFRYLKVEGGNLTKIAFEQGAHCSVRVLNEWQRYHPELIKTEVRDDTLFIKFVYSPQNMGEKSWMGWTTLVRIFSPELVYVSGHDTKMEMFKLNQRKIDIDMSGKSSFEIESMNSKLDSVRVTEKDSSEVEIEMSPEFMATETSLSSDNKARINIKGFDPVLLGKEKIKTAESMYIASVNAKIDGNSILDIGHAQINSLQLNISDSSAIILSGGALKKLSK
jgi:Putative auto-transporter adhesin, head GIN domain